MTTNSKRIVHYVDEKGRCQLAGIMNIDDAGVDAELEVHWNLKSLEAMEASSGGRPAARTTTVRATKDDLWRLGTWHEGGHRTNG